MLTKRPGVKIPNEILDLHIMNCYFNAIGFEKYVNIMSFDNNYVPSQFTLFERQLEILPEL